MIAKETIQCGLREIDPNKKEDAKAIAHLHEELLDWGPIAELGSIFLEKFSYSCLVREGLIKAVLYEVDSHAAGFIAYTAHSITFHRNAIKKHWKYVLYLVVISFFHNPTILFRLIKAFRLMLSRRAEKNIHKDPSAEILAIGVLPEYRTPQFIHKTGLRISEELLAQATSYFKNLGLDRMRAVVDTFNTPALMFYHNLGGHFEPYERAGDSMVQIWFDIESPE